METDFFSFFLPQSISWIPFVVVWAYGLVKARSLTGKYAGVGRKAQIAFAGFIISIIFNNVLFAYLMMAQGPAQVGAVMGVVNVLSVIVNVGLWLLVISAIFEEREKGAKMPEADPFAN